MNTEELQYIAATLRVGSLNDESRIAFYQFQTMVSIAVSLERIAEVLEDMVDSGRGMKSEEKQDAS